MVEVKCLLRETIEGVVQFRLGIFCRTFSLGEQWLLGISSRFEGVLNNVDRLHTPEFEAPKYCVSFVQNYSEATKYLLLSTGAGDTIMKLTY